MAQVAGVQIEQTRQGIPVYGRVGLLPRESSRVVQKEIKQKAIDPSKNPAVTGVPPRGYVTLEEFRRETKKMIDEYCDANGVS